MNVSYKEIRGKPHPTLSDGPAEGASRDIRQERLDQLMKTFEKSFPGFYEALVVLDKESRT